jgi:predicted ATPase/class 3 adenylate cyclase
MAELPSGTVSLLFSDIEGSTVLLSRLGPSYAEALDGQRRVLRRAWEEHGGTELGTEGDSFMVVFPTAEGAVAAAAEAQRELAAFDWPGGEAVRVRMGIHTGTPKVHDGGYVGMDVHRAARIAGSAHGGQVLLSEATAKLVIGCLPGGVAVRDLGGHQLKDIASAERLFQLTIDGLRSDFPPLKSLGAASSLPRPATPLVGRDGEVAELSALLSSPEVRLVTLTGPGGSGKTRLAIAVAQGLVERFPDGVFFVPLAAVTTSDVMWTSIAEVLDVPPEGRVPPGFFHHVAHRTALFVLDNLEQVNGADTVVAELLDHAPQAVAVATSRKLLAVPAEHVHPVPPLELPQGNSQTEAETSGAVQLFVHHCRRVKPSFMLSADNVADVTEICRRLDGLPLAIELAAARVRLLTPRALLARLDNALDLAGGNQAPTRQQTLRDTIAWSYDLLRPAQQALFRRLGVFAGGADLDAAEAVAASGADDGGADPFDLVAELVDASLITLTESADGEPRVEMLETVRAYALDQLTALDELAEVRDRHAHHYLHLAGEWRPLLFGEDYLSARARFDTEHDNFREALTWTTRANPSPSVEDGDAQLGLRLCLALASFWIFGGYWAEFRQWFERAVTGAGGTDSVELADSLAALGDVALRFGELDRAHEYATASVSMWRGLDDSSRLGFALAMLATVESELGHSGTARTLYEEALSVARSNRDSSLADCLSRFAIFEAGVGNFERSMELNDEAIAFARGIGDYASVLALEAAQPWVLRLSGHPEEAHERILRSIPQHLRLNEPEMLLEIAETHAAILADLGDHPTAVRLLGAADAMRERQATPRLPTEQAEIDEPAAKTHAALTDQDWEAAYQAGRNTTVEDALTEVHAAATGTP